MDIVVYCNALSQKNGFLQVENTFFHYQSSHFDVHRHHFCLSTRDKHTKASHAKCNLNMNCERTEGDFVNVKDLNLSLRQKWHVVDNFFLNCLMFSITIVFLTYLIKYSWEFLQFFFCYNSYRNTVFCHGMSKKQFFCGDEALIQQKKGF